MWPGKGRQKLQGLGNMPSIRCHFYKTNLFIYYMDLDASGNPVTETIQSVVVTDSSGNPVTGKNFAMIIC